MTINLSKEATTNNEVTATALFETEGQATFNSGANQLGMTAQLTRLSTDIANQVVLVVTAEADYANDVVASQQDHNRMDALINQVQPLVDIDVEFLKSIDGDELDKMIRSQQSKRSRAKSKAMTLDNYRTMMTGAVAEGLLRIAGGKPKGTVGGGSYAGSVTYTGDELRALAEDPESLTRAIRNVQSKKSIAKSKADFSVDSERWQLLLTAEEQLREVRSELSGMSSAKAQQAIESNEKAEELLAAVDLDKMSAKDAKEMLANVKEMLAGK